jgi:hypothetical protein
MDGRPIAPQRLGPFGSGVHRKSKKKKSRYFNSLLAMAGAAAMA